MVHNLNRVSIGSAVFEQQPKNGRKNNDNDADDASTKACERSGIGVENKVRVRGSRAVSRRVMER